MSTGRPPPHPPVNHRSPSVLREAKELSCQGVRGSRQAGVEMRVWRRHAGGGLRSYQEGFARALGDVEVRVAGRPAQGPRHDTDSPGHCDGVRAVAESVRSVPPRATPKTRSARHAPKPSRHDTDHRKWRHCKCCVKETRRRSSPCRRPEERRYPWRISGTRSMWFSTSTRRTIHPGERLRRLSFETQSKSLTKPERSSWGSAATVPTLTKGSLQSSGCRSHCCPTLTRRFCWLTAR